jgi:hypothetical protein
VAHCVSVARLWCSEVAWLDGEESNAAAELLAEEEDDGDELVAAPQLVQTGVEEEAVSGAAIPLLSGARGRRTRRRAAGLGRGHGGLEAGGGYREGIGKRRRRNGSRVRERLRARCL